MENLINIAIVFVKLTITLSPFFYLGYKMNILASKVRKIEEHK